MKLAKSFKVTKDIEPNKMDEMLADIYRFATKNVDFDDNVNGAFYDILFASNNQAVTIRHDLRRQPKGFFRVGGTGTGVLYTDEPWRADEDLITIWATVSGKYRIYVF